jgi:hypothetical protein
MLKLIKNKIVISGQQSYIIDNAVLIIFTSQGGLNISLDDENDEKTIYTENNTYVLYAPSNTFFNNLKVTNLTGDTLILNFFTPQV